MTFKNGCWKKNAYLFVTELKLQVRLSMQSLYIYASNDIRISTFMEKMGMRLQLSSAPLNEIAACCLVICDPLLQKIQPFARIWAIFIPVIWFNVYIIQVIIVYTSFHDFISAQKLGHFPPYKLDEFQTKCFFRNDPEGFLCHFLCIYMLLSFLIFHMCVYMLIYHLLN